MPETSKDLFPTRRNKFECVTQTVNAAQWGFPARTRAHHGGLKAWNTILHPRWDRVDVNKL